jgi:hypothetical protein
MYFLTFPKFSNPLPRPRLSETVTSLPAADWEELSRANLVVVMKFDGVIKITLYANAKRARAGCVLCLFFHVKSL